MSTKAKFQCNGINLVLGNAPNPEYNQIREEVEGNNPDLADHEKAALIRDTAKDRGIQEWAIFKMPTVKLNPVYAPDDPTHENYKFWTASPSGELTMTIANPAGAETFELGKQYYVEFTQAD